MFTHHSSFTYARYTEHDPGACSLLTLTMPPALFQGLFLSFLDLETLRPADLPSLFHLLSLIFFFL